MNTICKNLNTWRRFARLAALVAAFPTAWLMTGTAQIQETAAETAAVTATPPYALFQYGSLTGSGNTITASWVPIITASGATIYRNLTLQFSVDAAGNLTITPGYPQIVPAPIVQVTSFMAGNYVGPGNVGAGKALITVSGPGSRVGGATEWSLATTPGAWPSTYPNSAAWYAGALANNPLITRLQAAKLTSNAWTYGVVGSNPFTVDGTWFTNTLIGVSQIGDTLTIASFTDSGGHDHNVPVDQITYTRIK